MSKAMGYLYLVLTFAVCAGVLVAVADTKKN